MGRAGESLESSCTHETHSLDYRTYPTCQWGFRPETTLPIARFLSRGKKMKLHQRQPPDRTGIPRNLHSSDIFISSFLKDPLQPFHHPSPPPIKNSYRNNCSKARTWKEERKRLMKLSNCPSPPGSMAGRSSPLPGA